MYTNLPLFFVFKVTGPYWKLLHNDVQYVDLYKYVQSMYSSFDQWVQDVDQLLDGNSPGLFPESANLAVEIRD